MRIVSLVPSWTEYLVDLGLEAELVGRTKFCVRAGNHPERIARIGGTKAIKVEQIEALQPDIVIASKEENVRDQVEACAAFSDVVLTDVRDVQGAFEALETVAESAGCKSQGQRWRALTEAAWGNPKLPTSKAFYVIWHDPLMVAGRDTYIHSVMRWWGIDNAIDTTTRDRYPSLDVAQMKLSGCKQLLLSSEPYPFKAKHCKEFAAHGLEAHLVDGEAFSWYGSRMLHTAEYLSGIVAAI